MAHVVARKGYAATSLADLTAHAGISRASFYALYKDKEDCFLYCFHRVSTAHLAAMRDSVARTNELPQKLCNAVAAYFGVADLNPPFARTFVVEAQGATPSTQAAVASARDNLTAWLKGWFTDVRSQHPTVRPRGDIDFILVQEAVSGFLASSVRGEQQMQAQAAEVARFVFAALGLYGWAEHVAAGRAEFGTPLHV
jgi:AcrR family transcriptional regulator